MAIIRTGYDLFSVVPGSTSFNLEALFPGAGIIYSEGVPIDAATLGNFSTGLIRRSELPDGENGVVSIAMFAEHSISTKPVKLGPFGLGEGEADFHTIINLGGILPNLPNTDNYVRPSEGVMAIRRSIAGGGRFDLMLNINPLIVLTKVGGSVATLDGPDVIKFIDGSGLLNPVGSIGGQWTEAPHKTRAIQHAFTVAGTFFAALDRATGEPASVDLTAGGPVAGASRVCQGAIRF